jgi:hypothetical protein
MLNVRCTTFLNLKLTSVIGLAYIVHLTSCTGLLLLYQYHLLAIEIIDILDKLIPVGKL